MARELPGVHFGDDCGSFSGDDLRRCGCAGRRFAAGDGGTAVTVDVAIWGDVAIGGAPASNALASRTEGIKAEIRAGDDPSFYVTFARTGLNGVPTTIYLGRFANLELATYQLSSQASYEGEVESRFRTKGSAFPRLEHDD
jgi:hypothetical protein